MMSPRTNTAQQRSIRRGDVQYIKLSAVMIFKPGLFGTDMCYRMLCVLVHIHIECVLQFPENQNQDALRLCSNRSNKDGNFIAYRFFFSLSPWYDQQLSTEPYFTMSSF